VDSRRLKFGERWKHQALGTLYGGNQREIAGFATDTRRVPCLRSLASPSFIPISRWSAVGAAVGAAAAAAGTER
jgi:hypothetical protein